MISEWIYAQIMTSPVFIFPEKFIIMTLLAVHDSWRVRLTRVGSLDVRILYSKHNIEIFYDSFIDRTRVGRARKWLLKWVRIRGHVRNMLKLPHN